MVEAIDELNTPPDSSVEIRAASEALSSRVKRGSESTDLTSAYRVSSDAWSPLGSVIRATGQRSRSSDHSVGGSSAVGLAKG